MVGEVDFGHKTVDIPMPMVLEEWDPKTKDYTGRKIEKKVTYIIKTKDCQFWSKEDIEKYGFQIIGIK